MSSASTIQASIDSLDEEIAKLTEARETLVDLLGEEEAEKPAAKSSSRRARATKDDDEAKPASRRSRARDDKRTSERKASSSKKGGSSRAKSNGDSDGPTKKQQIEGMLDDGMSPREIADELGIATNYVYNVKRAM